MANVISSVNILGRAPADNQSTRIRRSTLCLILFGSLVDEYIIYQLQVVFFMRFIASVMILIFMASALSGCIVGEFVQSP